MSLGSPPLAGWAAATCLSLLGRCWCHKSITRCFDPSLILLTCKLFFKYSQLLSGKLPPDGPSYLPQFSPFLPRWAERGEKKKQGGKEPSHYFSYKKPVNSRNSLDVCLQLRTENNLVSYKILISTHTKQGKNYSLSIKKKKKKKKSARERWEPYIGTGPI